MKNIYRYNELGKGNYGWLQTSYHFSFANYYNPRRMNLGQIRVINHDFIQGHKGFDTHPHSDMEIITYIVDGELTHQDSMGHKRTLGRHGIQYMSAGTGVYHSEFNEGSDLLHLFQIWILPDKTGYKPQYGDISYENHMKQNKLLEMVAGEDSEALVKIHQKASISAGLFDQGQTLMIDVEDYDFTYLIVIDGEIAIGDDILTNGDAVENNESYPITFVKDSHVLLLKTIKR